MDKKKLVKGLEACLIDNCKECPYNKPADPAGTPPHCKEKLIDEIKGALKK